MRGIVVVVVIIALSTGAASARIGTPVAAFNGGPLMQQLSLSASSQTVLDGSPNSGMLYRYVSDDQAITVDLVVRGGAIEQQIMYAPTELHRAIQVTFFLQDAVGSVFGAQQGMIAYNTAVSNRTETRMTFGGYTMRFTPMDNQMRVLVSR
jgi:hypothetical protein